MDDLAQSAPFIPPISTIMECQIFLIGDLTFPFEQDLRQLLHMKDNASLQSFFDRVAFAFRQEFASLPLAERNWLPRFTTLVDLLANVDGTVGAPALRAGLMCLHHLGRFIGFFTEGSRPYPSAVNTYLLGPCGGSFAAAAIATSRTIAELIPAGVESVLVAFRVGLRSLKLQRDMEKPVPEEPRSWAAAVSLPETQANELVQSFSTAKSLPESSKLYISAVSPHNVTLNGPPHHLRDLLGSTSLKAHYLPVKSPYHAPHLYGSEDVDEILGQLRDKRLEAYKQQIPILSPSSGSIIIAMDFRALLYCAVMEIMCEQVRWDKILQCCAENLFQHTSFKACTIWPLASNGTKLLSSTLDRTTKLSVSSNNSLNLAVEAPLSAIATGKFEDSKIAITGFSGRFPEAASTDEFWELLRAGRDVHRTIPEDRFDWKAHFDPTGKKKNTSRVRYGCFINKPGLFDARFFNLSPREAETTDPMQRWTMMVTYEALEMAGFVPNRTPSTQQDRVGVFFALTGDDWREVNSNQDIDTYFVPGANRAFLPGRISYFFGFSGPSLSIDTACSSSASAIHTACTYLWRGECDTAVAGGANLLTNPDNFAGLDRGHFLSTRGNCNAFDDEASGYCRADAVGSVILKRLEDAEADNDPIFGIITAVNTNHCAHAVSITRPHEGDQVSLFKHMVRRANINPLHVSYIEMHGTGTQAGDATEMKSVLSIFVPGLERMPRYPLHLGTAKANIGHSGAASGVSSLIKVLLMMQKDEIPPHCGIKTKLNHHYPHDLVDRNVNIPLKPTPWCRKDFANRKRIAFLNNFSAAGGNTAILLEDAPSPQLKHERQDSRTVCIVTVTGKSSKSLKDNIENLALFLERNPDTPLPVLSYTTTARRIHHRYRTTYVGTDLRAIQGGLQHELGNFNINPIPSGAKIPGVSFVFTGQGSLYTGIGRQLFEYVSYFKENLVYYDRIAQHQGFPSFLPLVDGSVTTVEDVDIVINHLALSCIQMALSCLWISWGVLPSSAVGHSLGEYAALFTAGVLTASDTIYLVGTRAQLISGRCVKGSHSMLAIEAPLNAITPHLAGSSCEIACINQPTNSVISGPNQEISRLMEEHRSRGHRCVSLAIPYAFHSAQVDSILEDFEAAAVAVPFSTPSIPYMSPLLGCIVSDPNVLGPTYLSRACRNVVNFQGVLNSAMNSGVINRQTLWLEIGPHPACSGMIKSTLGSQTITLPSLARGTDTWKVLAGTLKSLYLSGIEVKWDEYHRDFQSSHQVLELPRYSWDLENYWIQYRNNFCLTKGEQPPPEQDGTATSDLKPAAMFVSPSVQQVLEEHNGKDTSYLLIESDIHDPKLAPIIQGHKINGTPVCPSSLYADMALTIAQYMLKANNMWTEKTGLDCNTVKLERPLIATANYGSQWLRVSASADWYKSIISLAFFTIDAHSQKIAEHATCLITVTANQTWIEDWKRNTYLIKRMISSLHQGVDGGSSHKMKRGMVYKLFGALVDYDAKYQGMQEVVFDSGGLEATAQVVFQVGDEGFYCNPCWIDSLGHIAGFIMNVNDHVHAKNEVFINHGWDNMRCATKFEQGKTYQTYNKMQLVSGTMYVGDTYVFGEGKVVAFFEGVKFQGVPRLVLDQLMPSKSKAAEAVRNQSNSTLNSAQEFDQARVLQAARCAEATSVTKIVTSTSEQPARITLMDDAVSRVIDVILDEARIDFAELDPDSEFADYGIDSLLSLTIASRLQEELGLNVSSCIFAEYPTVKDLTDYIRASAGTLSTSVSGSGVATPDSLEDREGDEADATLIVGVPLEKLEMSLPPALLADNRTTHDVENTIGMNSQLRTNPIGSRTTTGEGNAIAAGAQKPQEQLYDPPHVTSVRLQGFAKTANKALFLFPDGSGSTTSYAMIPQISPDIVVYGLNCPWMKTPLDLKCSLEHYAAKYLLEIRRRQPKGPYYFGGWSAGGICAYEAAKQLASAGDVVTKLILIDSPDPIGLENPPQRMYDFLEGLGFFGIMGKTPPSWLPLHFAAIMRMLDRYNVKPFTGRAPEIHMIYAKDGICKHPSDPRPETLPDDPRGMLWLLNNRTDFSGAGWLNLVGKENVKVKVLENVNHFSILAAGPQIVELSNFFAEAMK